MEIGYDVRPRAQLPCVQHSTFSLETFGKCIKLGFGVEKRQCKYIPGRQNVSQQ
jgi:hypothetical protein